MARYHVTRAAARDLAAIGRYTQRQWGTAQRRAYLERLHARMEFLVDHPHAGSPREDIRPGYRALHEGRHLIFYREVDDGVEVVRVLHDRMNLRQRFRLDPT